ncbi:response regulator [Flavobacterium sp. MAH-1]|uniref:histidine kinase n=1 Tax=Flavobacterium agri TaxID=2743471 RepID=A0A7Y9C4F9_9FLAO|nr:response regulator [Flavobacterium agri]NUY79845.1 response regulator [Flavobacterium agri]NYA69870.1 response regulator [Flavobacterium agri]
MQNTFKRNLILSFGASILLLLVSSGAAYLSIRSLLGSTELVDHTNEVIYNLNRGQQVMTDAQASMRGFLITGKDEYLSEYNGSEVRAEAYFNKLKQLTLDNPVQQNNLRELVPLRLKYFLYLQARIGEKKRGEFSVSELGNGKAMMAEMRTIIRRMESEELRLLKMRTTESKSYANYSVSLIVAAALVSLLLSGLFFVRILNDYNERTKLNRQLVDKEAEMAERIRIISGIAVQISQGNFKVRVKDSTADSLGSVADSLNNMATELDRSFQSLSDKEWLQTGVAGLADVMIGEKSTNQLAKDIITYVSEYTSSNAGVLYIQDGDSLLATAGYSYVPNPKRERLQIGQGLVGQAVESDKLIQLKADSPDNISISYALGEMKPKHIIAIPLKETNVEGALELATANSFTALQLEFILAVADNIAIALKGAQNRAKVQELLEETQAQSEELRVQHTELESMNAELEAQTEKLQASEEELKVQQEELQQTNEELAERSVLLEERNTEIQKKSEDLERTTRYKSEFLANMSHELRTPLNSILLLSRLLSENNEKNMTEEQAEFARVINSSGNGLLGLIDEILDLSKIEAGKMDLEFAEISVPEITGSMRSLFGEVAKDKGIEFHIDDKGAPIVVKTDKMRLEQILKNLISNAIKFTEKGSVTLSIAKSSEKSVTFSVKDTGIGIPPEKQLLIFEAFQQADGSTKRKYGGTGLGLSISRELAKLLRGELKLNSVVGEGSEFTLTIPLSASSAPVVITKVKEDTDETTESDIQIQKKDEYISQDIPEAVPDDRDNISEDDRTILIVEDDTNFAKSLLEFTHQRGYKGIVSVRGDHALNLALAFKPVGILLDIQLPVKSGWEVMEELKNNGQTRHIPVHIMSSHKLKQESLLKGAVNFLDKPVAYEQIPDVFKRIEQIVNRESQKVLIIEDNPKHAKALAYFLDAHNINSEIKSDISEGVDALKKTEVHCVILDMGIPDKHSYEILENVKKNKGFENLPVIVFTGKSLSLKEEVKIKHYADSIIVKTAHSYQRMLDEVSLFLHLMEEQKKADGKNKKVNLLNNVLNGKTVLVVDDDVRNIYSLTKALETLKMNVITAIDGKEALKMLDSHPETDVVLLDMMMPNMDGYETATRIRENKKYKNLPVIAVTAKAMTGDREKCINAGASDYITKPVDVDQLMSLLRVWLYDKN